MKWIKIIRVQLVDQEVQRVFASIGFERREPPKVEGRLHGSITPHATQPPQQRNKQEKKPVEALSLPSPKVVFQFPGETEAPSFFVTALPTDIPPTDIPPK